MRENEEKNVFLHSRLSRTELRKQVDEAVQYLESIGIDAAFKSYLEDDYLKATTELATGAGIAPSSDNFRAISRLSDLHYWLTSIKRHREITKLRPHIEMLVESSTGFNEFSHLINPVTGKQDDKSNKFVETFLGMFALNIGTELELDDPGASSGGTNPDLLFNFDSRRIGIACKTLRSKKIETILDNFEVARAQIDRSECDVGYCVVNSMNIFPHDQFNNYGYSNLEVVARKMKSYISNIYHFYDPKYRGAWEQIFRDTKMSPLAITIVNTSTYEMCADNNQIKPRNLRRVVTNMFSENDLDSTSYAIVDKLNDFLQGAKFGFNPNETVSPFV